MLRLRVLGGFGLEGPSGTSITLPKRRAEAVLAVLSLCGDLACTRERLIALLWPESDEAHSRHALRDALHVIRQALGPDAVHAAGDRLRLDPAVVGSDVHAFSQALTQGRYAEAVRAYGGPFLDGFHVDGSAELERWVDGERIRLARQFMEALEHLATAAESRGAWGEAAGWWGRAVEQDPVNTHLVLRHMRALAAMGDGANAIKVADRYAHRLREELDLNPDREVLTEVERIRRGEVPARSGIGDRAAGLPTDVAMTMEPRSDSETPPSAAADPASSAVRPAGIRRSRRVPWAAEAATVVLVAAAAVVWYRMKPVATQPRYPRTSIAVLPFRNLSADTAHTYFASGLHDELLTQLAKVATLRVIGRTSVGEYEGTSKPLHEIGDELAVGSIVEGSVQVVQTRLRVTVQLVDPATEEVLWADRYDRTLGDVFAVESDIAQQIVATAGARLTRAEAVALTAAPTQNAEAYQLYLQGLDYWRRPREIGPRAEVAQQLFERALALDSTFALAHAALSLVHGENYQNFGDRSFMTRALQRHEAEAALRLAPDLPQAHLAMGVVYHVRYEDAQALAEFGVALRGAPNDADAWEWAGFAHRELGNWDSALVAFDHGIRLDPRDVKVIVDRGYTLEVLRRYGAAVDAFRQALELAPDLVRAHIEIGYIYMKWKGDWDTLNAVVAGLPVETWHDALLGVNLLQRRADKVLALLRAFPGPAGLSGLGSGPRALTAAQAYRLRGDWAAARAAFDSAVTLLDSVERARPDDWLVHGMRGEALAGLGRRADALREARWLEQSDAYRKDRFGGAWPAASRSIILAGVGETDAAIAELERLLAHPSHLSVPELRLNQGWDPIRNDPRFEALLVKYAHPAEQ
jgi:TolB-like protein/DNA-binding SARP family transcriptional activator/Flp pilus assembly protein TadD